MVLSPTNQLLLLHRVQTSTSFPSAHVFPGGNLSKFHEAVPAEDANDRHRDSEAYRLGAIRETFEEAGILLAKKDGGRGDLVELSPGEVEEARKKIHGNKVRFGDWVESVGGTPDVGEYMEERAGASASSDVLIFERSRGPKRGAATNVQVA